MNYSIRQLATLAGVSTRTLRYYDQCGLLVPKRVSNGYRVYTQAEVDRLQQILFYKELDVELAEIGRILSAEGFDNLSALQSHLTALQNKQERLRRLIANVEQTIKEQKGECTMQNDEKFEGFKQELIRENEAAYGSEIRERYGEEAVEQANAKVRGMTVGQYQKSLELEQGYQQALLEAFRMGDPESTAAQEACELHKQWLCCYWASYSKQAHIGVTQLYVDDPRFTAYYNKIAPGCAAFLRDAVALYCKE